MVNNNKILTVSYGTFSCTLEGFDDSFGTMKAISEYFRDLAADDRYFGAEPPTPDAEMLARIAEREISRRVAAHREDNTYVLRADPGSVLPVAAKAAATAVEDATIEAPVSTPAVTPEPAAAPAAAAAEPVEKTAPAVEIVQPTPIAEAAATPDLSGLSALVAESVATTNDTLKPEPAPETAVEEVETAELATPLRRQPDPESVAAKLQRIRDVVSKTSGESDYSEDEHATELLLDDEDATASLVSEDAQDEAIDELAAMLANDTLETKAEEAAVEEPAATEADADLDFDFEDENDAEGEDDDINALLREMSTDDEMSDEDDFEAEEDNLEDEAEVAPLRARVIKMKKADFEAAIADGYIEEDGEDDDGFEDSEDDGEDDNAGVSDKSSSSLSDDDEAELLKELAEVEAELGQAFDEVEDDFDDADGDGEDTAGNLFSDDAESASAPRRARLKDDTDAQMGRILEETNSQLQEETGKGRRNAIAHLRAAVAATEAERGAGGDLGADGRDTEVYRDDLETVVRPRRPAATSHTARPSAPLKLVAEQRIDTPKPETPVQPRRVRTPAPAAVKPTQDDEFADYLDDVGAYNLGEVLEAAASYMAFVEGQEAFSRPQLMSKLNSTEHADTSREDRLRSFGQLLREGKIRKLGGGRFEASEHISYRPEVRVAGA